MLTFETGSRDPFFNQAFEEYVFQTVVDEDVFYVWRHSPVVVVGCYQNICREVDALSLLKENIPIIRRISGGGTVYHDFGNLNYTYIADRTQAPDYDACLAPVLAAMNRMGLRVLKNKISDLTIDGRKISGSAQKVAHGRVLHHGTLLFETDLEKLNEITTSHKNHAMETKGTLSAISSVTNIREHLPTAMTIDRFAEELVKNVPESMTCRLLTEAQRREVERLAQEKYQSWEWTWGVTPTYTYRREGVFAGRPISVEYTAKKGRVTDITLRCDVINEGAARSCLIGTAIDPTSLLQAAEMLAPGKGEQLLQYLL